MSSAESPHGYNFQSIVPHPDTRLLRCDSAASGYRNVYLHRYCDQWRDTGEPRFVAKVKVGGRLMRIRGSAGPCAHVVALYVLCWYRDRYGARWRDAIQGRHLRPAAVLAVRSRRLRGWRCRVWEWGAPVEVTGYRMAGRLGDRYDTANNVRVCARHWSRPGRALVFRTRAEAERFALRVWSAQRWGLFSESALWRVPDAVAA